MCKSLAVIVFPCPDNLVFSSDREFDVKALCEGAGGDPDEEELSPDSACSAESPASHSDQPHDRELLRLPHVVCRDLSPRKRL